MVDLMTHLDAVDVAHVGEGEPVFLSLLFHYMIQCGVDYLLVTIDGVD